MRTTTLKKVTTGLAGAVAIAGGSQAYGAIVNVTPPATLTNTPGGGTQIPGATTGVIGTFTYWDVNSDGTNDFLFTDRYPNTAAGSYGVVWQENMNPATSALATTNGVISYAGAFVRYGTALSQGFSIATGGAFSTTTAVTLGSRYSYGANGVSYYGGFATGGKVGQNYFAGFRFASGGNTYYGYVQLAVSAGQITFVNAAYNNTPNTAILAGARAVPEPGTMAALAVGAMVTGVAIKRRRQKAA